MVKWYYRKYIIMPVWTLSQDIIIDIFVTSLNSHLAQKSLNIFPLCKMTGYLLHNSCIMYLNDLPDMYTQAQGPQAQGRGVPYQVNTRGYVIQLICTMRPE